LHPGHDCHSAQYDDAAGAYCLGHFDEAAATFAELVELECGPAAAYLAEMYLRGEGVARDVQQGLELLQMAASWGYAIAAFNLGALHRSGDCGVPRDPESSRRYFMLARELGCEIPVEPFLQ
jgi:TPR repeat protein